MPTPDAKTILIANVKLLMDTHYGEINITRFGRETGLNNGGTQRVLAPEVSVGVDQLNKIAKRFNVDVWQLLAPNLGQAMLLSPAELEAVRKIREPQQPKAIRTEHIETKQIASPMSNQGAGKKRRAV